MTISITCGITEPDPTAGTTQTRPETNRETDSINAMDLIWNMS